MTTSRYLLATIIAAGVLGACGGGAGGDTPGPVEPPPVVRAGTATFSLAAAPEGLGAVRLRFFGPGMSNPVIRGGAKVMALQTVADTTTVLVSMTSTLAAFLDVSLSDRSRVPTIVVQEATAGRLDGYRSLPASSVVVSTNVP